MSPTKPHFPNLDGLVLEVKMAGQFSLNHTSLQEFAPNSPILAFRPADGGSPQQDWCAHLQAFPHRRRELEEFAVLGDVVVRIADGHEPAPLDKVKILSLEYAVKTLKSEDDAKEFVRVVKAIASSDAGQYELEQIVAFYYGEIRRRGIGNTSEVLKEMGLLGMQMEAVTATVEEREIEFFETEIAEQKLTVADERRVKAAKKNLPALPAPTPNFDAELAFIAARVGNSKITRTMTDEFAEFYLNDEEKTCEELDADFMSFERLKQYDENGIVGFSMSGDQHAVVVYDFSAEVSSEYLPADAQSLAREMNLIFVGHALGGAAARRARQFTFAHRVSQNELSSARKGFPPVATPIPPPEKFSALPFSDGEFGDWLAAKLDFLYPHRVLRNARRLTTSKAGFAVEFMTTVEFNPAKENSLRSQGTNQQFGMMKYEAIPGGSQIAGTTLPIRKGVEFYDFNRGKHILQKSTNSMNNTTTDTTGLQNENTNYVTQQKIDASTNYQGSINQALENQASQTVGAINAGTNIAASSAKQGAGINIGGINQSAVMEKQTLQLFRKLRANGSKH